MIEAQNKENVAISKELIEIGNDTYPNMFNIFDIFNDQHIIRISRISDPLGRIPQQRQAKAINALLKVSFMLKKETNPTLEIKYSFEQLFLLWKIHQILTNKTLSGKKLINKGNFLLLLKKNRLDYNPVTTVVSVNDDTEPNILNDLYTNFTRNQKIEDFKNLFGKPSVKEGGLYDIVDNYYTDLGIPTVNPNDSFRQDLLTKIRQDKASGRIVPASGGGPYKLSKATNTFKATGKRLPVNTNLKQQLEANIDKSISNIEKLHIDYWENKFNESDYDNELIHQQIRLFTNLYHLNKHTSLFKIYITNDTIKIENPNTNKIESISQQYIIKMYYEFLKPYINDDTDIYNNEFFLNDDIHTFYKKNISQIKIKVDTQHNIPGTMRTGLTGIQSPPPTQFPKTLGVGGKKKTRKYNKQKTKKHKKNNTYKKK